MRVTRSRISAVLAVLLLTHCLIPQHSSAGDKLFGRIKRLIGETGYHGTAPVTGEDGAIECLAENIDWLEHYIDRYGSVVAKQPDIWGEARLTKHRDEYERVMFDQLGGFEQSINASISQSDSAFLSQAIALSNAAAGGTVTPAPAESAPVAVANAQLIEADDLTNEFKRFGIDGENDPADPGISLEPVVVLDQMSRYLKHLHELRRINEGDDTSDSPGYSLNLVRIPVSIMPGKLTREGFGAEVTVSAEPVLSDDLMPTTFRNLAVNDAIDFLGLPLVRVTEQLDAVENYLVYQKTSEILESTFSSIETALNKNTSNEMGFIADAAPPISSFFDNEKAVEIILGGFAEIEATLDPAKASTAPSNVASDRISTQIAMATRSSIAQIPTAELRKQFVDPATRIYLAYETRTKLLSNGQTVEERVPVEVKEHFDTQAEMKLLINAVKQADATKTAIQIFRFSQAKDTDAPAILQLVAQNALGLSVESMAKSLGEAAVVPSGRTRRALNPINPSSLVPTLGIENLAIVSKFFNKAYYGRYIRWSGGPGDLAKCDENRVDLLDARRFLRAELDAAYELLSRPEHVQLFACLASPCSKLADEIRAGHFDEVETYRKYFFQQLHTHNTMLAEECFGNGPPMMALDSESPTSAQTPVQALAWAVVVEAALLNDRLNLDVHKLANAAEAFELQTDRDHWFFLPDVVMRNQQGGYLQEEFTSASEVFKSYVKVRWPIHVFAVDPVTQDQNVADVSQRQRELQFALALGFATGKIGINSLTQYSRTLQTQIETIGLNRTIVGFGHGTDTFGWRFFPRVQALPVPGTLGSIRETLLGTSRDYDLRHRQIEPGQRECVAVVLMPSFVPYADFDVRTNWFKLTNPKNSALTMKDTVKLSRSITAMRNSRAQCAKCQHLYREGELARLFKRVDQLDRELPLQTQRALVPYENTLGGFEMFNTGVTDLSPELVGWYGAPGINTSKDSACGCTQGCSLKSDGTAVESGTGASPIAPCEGAGTTLFLVGNNFSVHDTKVIAGGVCIPHVRLISRDLMRVTIPDCVNTMKLCEGGDTNEYVAVYVATPYGITNHLHVPVYKPEEEKIEDQIKAEITKQIATLNLPQAPATVSAGSKVAISAIGDPTTMDLRYQAVPEVQIAAAKDPRFAGRDVTIYGAILSGETFLSQTLTKLREIPAGNDIKVAALGQGDELLDFLKTLNPALVPTDGSAYKLKIVYFVAFDQNAVPTRLAPEIDLEITRFPTAAAAAAAAPPAATTPTSTRAPETDCNCQTASARLGTSMLNGQGQLRVQPVQQRSSVPITPLAEALQQAEFGELLERLDRIEGQQRGNLDSVNSLLEDARETIDAVQRRPNSTVEVSVNLPKRSEATPKTGAASGALLQRFKTNAGQGWRNLRDKLPGN